MNERAPLREVPPPFVADFSQTGALRQNVGEAGRAHVDRWLPFLILQRSDAPDDSLARRVAVDSPSYIVWTPRDDAAALSAIETIAERLSTHFGRLLVITLDDRAMEMREHHSAKLPPFLAEIGAGESANADRAADALEKALRGVEIDLRRCKVSRDPFRPILPTPFDQMLRAVAGVERLSLRLPHIHRRPDGGIFPGLAHDLSVASGDALLRSACAFLDDGKAKAPAHYRALGRSAYLAAALKADRKIQGIARSFDFLLSISPIDTSDALQRFLEGGSERAPHFHYRPLTVDPDVAKRELYAVDLRALEDPLLETLLGEKRREIDAQLTMLATRNTPSFRPASMLLYGAVDPPLLTDAESILAATDKDPPRGSSVGAQEIAEAAEGMIAAYRAIHPGFDAEVQVRDDVSGLLVSGPRLMIGSDTVMPRSRLTALLSHEVSVHLLTYFNGAAQGLTIFSTGLAGYEGVQEGLGVFAEWAVGGLTRTRLRLLAARVIAVDAMLHGADFIQAYRLIHKDHGFSRRGAFGITSRVFRSGGLAKDAIYLKGFRAVFDFVAAGASLQPFWLGKIAPGHVPAIEELLQRGLVSEPRFLPLFLGEKDTQARIARLRGGTDLQTMLAGA